MLHLVEAELGGKAHYSHNANSAFGVAFDILGLDGIRGSKLKWIWLFLVAPIKAYTFTRRERFYVVEVDGERPHETEFIAKWLKPDITVWVSLGRSHAVWFEKVVATGRFANVDEAITHEFASLPRFTRKLVIFDKDNAKMAEAVKNVGAKIVGLSKSAVSEYLVYPTHTDFRLGKNTFHFAQPMPQDLATQLAMLEYLMKYLEMPISYDLSGMQMPPGRSSYFEGVRGIKIIDSSYNAHLISMASILAMTKSLRAGHKWLVIGDIIDQGKLEEEEHRKLADLIVEAKPERVILVGRRTREYTAPILEERGVVVNAFLTPQPALKFIRQNISGEETLIFKGSQYLEWIVEKLLANPADAFLLARREAAAIKRRAERGLE
jgi:UDP-N-acetylmuramoyl-tripeptide--D-alanyl-D-alanine ligase